MTIYSVHPLQGQAFEVGDTLVVYDPFPPHVRLVLLRRPYDPHYVACVDGDGAADLRLKDVWKLRVTEVSAIGGWAKAVKEECP